MPEVLEDEQEKSAATAEVENAFGTRALEVQILYPLPIQSQPRLDICVFGVTRSRIRISLLNFARTFAIDVLQHRRKRNAKDRPLHPAPATMVGQRLSKLENFTGNFHSCFVRTRNCRATAPVANHDRKAGDAPALQCLNDLANQSRSAIDQSAIKLN